MRKLWATITINEHTIYGILSVRAYVCTVQSNDNAHAV